MTLSPKIISRRIFKPYLGGWRHKITGIEYLNAASQTGPLRKSWKTTCSRSVQCVETKDGTTQSLRHCVTQMWRDDCYIPSEEDKYMIVKPYKSYAEVRAYLDRHARIIQRNYRAYRLKKYIKECVEVYRNLLENCNKYEEEKIMAYEMRHKQNILRQTFPRSRTDFGMLYSLIERWRSDCIKDIKSRLFKGGQRAENYRILEKTVEMFNQVDKHKQAIKSSYRKQKVLRFLALNCKSIRWTGYKGKLVEMITLKIQKAREFKELYNALSNRNVSSEERIKLLIMLRKLLEPHNCIEAFDLISLLDQEIALLNRRIEGLSLDYLNERIMHTYLNFVSMYSTCGCKCVDADPKDNELREPFETRMKLCRNCLKLLPFHRFLSHTRMKKLSVCIRCRSLAQRNIAHVDYDSYMFILNCVRAEEERRSSTSLLAFMMQEHDIYHLVNHIWQGKSAISKIKDLFVLRLVRYQKDVEWAPWNCILLTEDEAEVHYHIRDLATMYSKHLISQISLKHQIAKNYFKQLIIFEKDFRESSRYSSTQNGIQYKPPLTVENYDPSQKYKQRQEIV
ncbi:IQ and ubiquitin-like domain-containing protein isoform X1 [Cataglyphis hispanica]|uniref:IQ and ubiquitin-like domain-containing protein isoform X1 n=1 Tax=Cataglyphis hispanica TaxID=1086592 RepID=UPI00217FC7D8|nr:IQ and ubiquitin-like domain-containing protein isoform X1 [Cataglyphis hispanica]